MVKKVTKKPAKRLTTTAKSRPGLKTKSATKAKSLTKATGAKKATKPAATKLAAAKATKPVKATPKAKAQKSPASAPKALPKNPPSRKLADAIAKVAEDKKAEGIEILDVRGKVDYADFVVVMSGRSDRQVTSLARSIDEDMKRNQKTRCLSIEGLSKGVWVLMDYEDVVVHIFHEETRHYYDLESLWTDSGRDGRTARLALNR